MKDIFFQARSMKQRMKLIMNEVKVQVKSFIHRFWEGMPVVWDGFGFSPVSSHIDVVAVGDPFSFDVGTPE
jgi:hypothetical protein